MDDEISNLQALRQFLEEEGVIEELGRNLASSEPLVVIGLRASAPLAAYFGYFAERIHPDVRLIKEEGSVGMDRLGHARRSGASWALCFVLPRYPRETLEMLDYTRDLGIKIAAVTDRVSEPVGRLSEVLLPAGVGSRLVFDSQTAAMALSTALLEALSDAAPARAQASLEDFEHRATSMEWFAAE